MTASGFYGAGLQHPGVETAVAQCNKLLMHYGCKTSVGSEFQILIELFFLEIGASFQPLHLQFDKYADRTTHCWFNKLWEKASTFGFKIIINNISLKFARRGDKWLMEFFKDAGFSKPEILDLNRVRLHQKLLFLSDVFSEGGRYIEKILTKRRPEKNSHTVYFCKKDPQWLICDCGIQRLQQ